MGQDIDLEFMHDNVERVIRRAAGHETFVRFDMEGSDYTQPTLDFFKRLWDEGLLDEGTYPGIATHDPAMIDATIAYMKERGYGPDRFEFQMLYGVRRDLQRKIVEQGLRIRIYVPYGEAWYPYLMRRMAERPANLLFVAGNIVKEALPGR